MAERRTPEIKYIKGFGWTMICYGDNRICWDISKENDMDYVKDGTLIIQARTIKEVNSIDRVVVYADGCQREYLMPLPTVEERKEGRWIDTDYINLRLDTYLASCSECGYQMNVCINGRYFKYCPNCGAKMYEDDKDIYVPNKGE